MALNRLEIGTKCVVRSTGESGTIKQIYFYPTKYELEFSDGRIEHIGSKDLEINGIVQESAVLQTSTVPKRGIGESWSTWVPFKSESLVRHHFSTNKEIMWETLISLDMYNVWFYGIQRALPISDNKRYVHRYSFNQMDMKPGSMFKARVSTLAPYFKCKIMTMEKEKKFGFYFRSSPLLEEYVLFTIEESDLGVWLTCERKSSGPFSVLSQFNWPKKSKILQSLDEIIPKIEQKTDLTEDTSAINQAQVSIAGGIDALSKEDLVAYLVNKGMDGDMATVNDCKSKVARGKAKAMMVKIKRGTVERPPMPEIPQAGAAPAATGGGVDALSKEDLVAYLVNKGMDGDMATVNDCTNKVARAKAKAMMVKIKRGTVERPPMPEIPQAGAAPAATGGGVDALSKEDLVAYLVNKGMDGDMATVNDCTNKVARAKAKAMMVKIKRGTVERPPMPEIPQAGAAPAATGGGVDALSKEDLVAYLVNKGMDGDMATVNDCTNKVARAKAKAMMVKIKRGTVERPPMPEIPQAGAAPAATGGGVDALSKEDLVAYLVNKGMDGDMATVNDCTNKVARAKAKAMMVKIKRGTVERPPMPEIQ